MTGPKIRVGRFSPATGERRHQGGAAEPSPRFSLGGRTLIGKECDQPSARQSSMSHPVSGLIVEDRSLMEMADMGKQSLPPRTVRRSSDSNGVRTENMENACQPLPIPMMHGEKEGGDSMPCPLFAKRLEGTQVQLVPSAAKQKGGLVAGIDEKASGKIGWNRFVDGASQHQRIVSSGNRKDPSQDARSDPDCRMGWFELERKLDPASIDGLDCVRQEPENTCRFGNAPPQVRRIGRGDIFCQEISGFRSSARRVRA